LTRIRLAGIWEEEEEREVRSARSRGRVKLVSIRRRTGAHLLNRSSCESNDDKSTLPGSDLETRDEHALGRRVTDEKRERRSQFDFPLAFVALLLERTTGSNTTSTPFPPVMLRTSFCHPSFE